MTPKIGKINGEIAFENWKLIEARKFVLKKEI
jgi:hypothetical protein